MKTIALRFGEQFSPECGTIQAHQEVLDELGFVWYGKLGSAVSMHVIDELMMSDNPRILLIHSGRPDRYWAYVTEIRRTRPDGEGIPVYYGDLLDDFSTWFKVKKIEKAPKDIMRKCRIASSGNILGQVSKRSMSPYFIIKYDESGE